MSVSKDFYKDLSVEEMLQDDFFIESIQQPDEEKDAFWKEFLLLYPKQKEVIEEAGYLIARLRFTQDVPEPGIKDQVWQRILEEAPQEGKLVSMGSRRKWMWAAAVATGSLLLSLTWLFSEKPSTTLVTAQFKEIKEIMLPDLSVVTLNANSSLEYNKEWKNGQAREVWLKGEGFFDIRHLNKEGQPVKEEDRFIVHVGEMQVEVLGTSFNVSDRKSITKVVLQSGKVKIDFKTNTGSVVMEPGDQVKYNKESKLVVKEKTDTIAAVSWKQKEIVLNNTTVQDLVAIIENNYGYRVEPDDKELLSRQVSGTGTVSLENEETLFRALEVMLNIEITKTNKTIYLKKR